MPRAVTVLTLHSYPTLFGVADNNGYGLKVYAFLRLVGLPLRHKHVLDIGLADPKVLALRASTDPFVHGARSMHASQARIADCR
jgi:hypothetical protein